MSECEQMDLYGKHLVSPELDRIHIACVRDKTNAFARAMRSRFREAFPTEQDAIDANGYADLSDGERLLVKQFSKRDY